MRYLIAILTFVAVAAMLFSCDHKEIVCPYGEQARVEVVYDWENAPEADPEGMALYFYPQSPGGKIWRFDLSGRDGGSVELPCGRYSLVTCNNDRPGVTLLNTDSYHTVGVGAPLAGDKGMLGSTGMLYSATLSEVDVTPCGVSYITPQGEKMTCPYGVVRCAPDSLSTLYTVIISDVEGLDSAKTSTATIAGVGSSVTIADESVYGIPSDLATALDAVREDRMLSGSVCGFAPSDDPDYSLRVTVRRKDGLTIAHDFPQSDIKVITLSRHHVIISADGLDIPGSDKPAEPGDIEVGVDGWVIIETELTTD